MGIKFSKFHGFGNDYVVIEAEELRDVADIFEFTKRFCLRTLGVGSDGIAILENLYADDADFGCRIINPDGSEAGFSGNGTRCAVAYAYYKGLWGGENLRLKTKSGIKNYRFVEEISPGHYWFDAEIGKPKLAGDDIPFVSEFKLETVIDQPISVGGKEYLVSCVNVGNPVACVFNDNLILIGENSARNWKFTRNFRREQILYL